MPDFTKDELLELKRCVKYMIKGDVTPYSSLTMAINTKLQSMIDKYCRHKVLKEIHHCDSCLISEYRCGRCSQIIYEGLF